MRHHGTTWYQNGKKNFQGKYFTSHISVICKWERLRFFYNRNLVIYQCKLSRHSVRIFDFSKFLCQLVKISKIVSKIYFSWNCHFSIIIFHTRKKRKFNFLLNFRNSEKNFMAFPAYHPVAVLHMVECLEVCWREPTELPKFQNTLQIKCSADK